MSNRQINIVVRTAKLYDVYFYTWENSYKIMHNSNDNRTKYSLKILGHNQRNDLVIQGNYALLALTL